MGRAMMVRFMWALALLVFVEGEGHGIYCRRCGTLLASDEDELRSGVRNEEGEFVNQSPGLQLLLLNVNKDKSVQKIKKSNSYQMVSHIFPPYLPSIASCHVCNNHVGWHFKWPTCNKKAREGEDEEDSGLSMNAATVDSVLDSLRGECLTSRKTYWTYEWCHEVEVLQYHVTKGIRNPEWSLGKFEPA